MTRTIIVGDIHGCHPELEALLEKVELRDEDHLIAIGDTVVKGSAPLEVLKTLRKHPNTTCLLGNMEWRLLQAWNEGTIDDLPPAYKTTMAAFGKKRDEMMKWISEWPLMHRMGHYVCVHAGVRAGRPLDEQTDYDLLHIREVRPSVGPACGGLLRRPWYEHWNGPETIIFGHMPHAEPVIREHAIGLDTGCVRGGHLTALILPTREIVQVRAKASHWTDDRTLL